MTLLAVAVGGAAGAVVGYVVEDHSAFPSDQLGRRMVLVALRAFGLGFLVALVLIDVVFTDTSGGELLADLSTGYIVGDVVAAVLRVSDADTSTDRPGVVRTIAPALVGFVGMLLGAAAALVF